MTATATPTRKPRRKPDRFVDVLSDVLPSGSILIRIEERGPRSSHSTAYFVTPLPADFGRGFLFAKFEHQGGEKYHVNTGDESHPASCECLGHEKWGHRTVCKHLACARKLIAEGKFAALDPATAAA